MQKRYSKEFKETLIDFYHSGQSVTQLSKEYSVSPATIYKWIDLYSKSNESSVSKADFLELKRLELYYKSRHKYVCYNLSKKTQK